GASVGLGIREIQGVMRLFAGMSPVPLHGHQKYHLFGNAQISSRVLNYPEPEHRLPLQTSTSYLISWLLFEGNSNHELRSEECTEQHASELIFTYCFM
ncbi:hypothetical protein, partial [uncultured Amphritea sp.]|uniref:hypothetical protein n=1 Tax=uncultured Amphritea sp. TaxID=981605 RepID=UPI00260A674D